MAQALRRIIAILGKSPSYSERSMRTPTACTPDRSWHLVLGSRCHSAMARSPAISHEALRTKYEVLVPAGSVDGKFST
jgi:hypothetical protein